MADNGGVDPLVMAKLLQMYQGGAAPADVNYASASNGNTGLDLYSQSPVPGAPTSQFEATGYSGVPMGDANLYGSITGGQNKTGQETTQFLSPTAGVAYGPLDVSGTYNMDKWAGYGETQAGRAGQVSGAINAPIGDGSAFLRMTSGNHQQPTYSAGYNAPLFGGKVSARADTNEQAKKLGRLLLTYSKDF